MREPQQLPENQPQVKDLERLVELETHLDELLQASRSEAAALIARARDRTVRAEQDWAADFWSKSATMNCPAFGKRRIALAPSTRRTPTSRSTLWPGG